jgi:flagellar biosynthesis protein FlhF
MRIYAQILNVPFAIVRQKTDWDKIMAQLVGYDQVLVDFSGVGLKTLEEISFVRNLIPAEKWNPQIHLVLSCLAKDSDLTEIGKRYKVTGFQDVIFTGLDESAQHGTIYNFMKRFNIPLHSFGIGTRVPEDFEVATRERVLDLIFKITKMNRTSAEGTMP